MDIIRDGKIIKQYNAHSRIGNPESKYIDFNDGNWLKLKKNRVLRKTKKVKTKRGIIIDRKYCSEAKIFEQTAAYLKDLNKIKDKPITINMYTENFPCQSCLGVIKQFAEFCKITNIDMDLNVFSGK